MHRCFSGKKQSFSGANRCFLGEQTDAFLGSKPMLFRRKPMLFRRKPMLFRKKPMLFWRKPMLFWKKPMLFGKKPMLFRRKPMLFRKKPMLFGRKPMLFRKGRPGSLRRATPPSGRAGAACGCLPPCLPPAHVRSLRRARPPLLLRPPLYIIKNARTRARDPIIYKRRRREKVCNRIAAVRRRACRRKSVSLQSEQKKQRLFSNHTWNNGITLYCTRIPYWG